ncbi:MAG: protein kinase, partial [Polyangiales bacterium]
MDVADVAQSLTGDGASVMTKCKRCGEELTDEEICPRCGAIVGTLKTPLVIDGRYSVERTLGAGSMGVVHLARDLKTGRRVALKMIAPEMATEPLATGRFAREAATLAAIRNEHVVRVQAFGKHAGSHFFVMEYVHGKDADDIITAYANHRQYVPVHRTLTILRQVARGLEAVHAAG